MNKHYEERMQADLEEIRNKVKTVSDLVEDQVQNAVHALLTGDRGQASRVVLGDRQVNRRIKEIDYLCHSFIVRHAPSARPLRFASAVLRLDVALERVGDYADSIGRIVARLSGPPPGTVSRDIELIANQARHALSQALTAFHEGDAELASRTYGLADQTDLTLETVIAELISAGEKSKRPLEDIFGLLRVITLIKRVAEQSENICEQAIFALTGKSKDARVFRILFVGERNDLTSQIAEAHARKAFPESGVYSSAGWNPADALDPGLVEYLDGRGIDMRDARPATVSDFNRPAEHFHVMVLLSPDAREKLGLVPYRTTVIEWDLETDVAKGADVYDALYHEIADKVQHLMTTLAGPDAR